MDLMEFLILAGVAAVLGLAAQKILGYKLGGLFVSVLLGFGGAYLGKELALWLDLRDMIHLSINGRDFPVLWAIGGSLVVTFLVGSIGRRAARREKKTT
jgi:uncharacterized membrane protein YeaQ/YmgE (transglycosylase-associated protein family)